MLKTIPFNIYKVPDPGHERTESWYFNLLVMQDGIPKRLQIDLLSDETIVKSVHYGETYLDRLKGVHFKPTKGTPPNATVWHANQEEAFDLRLCFSEPTAQSVNYMKIKLELESSEGEMITGELDAPVNVYEQNVNVIFPLKMPCIILQGHVNNGGHTNWSSQFAFDAFGLTPTYGIMTEPEYTNTTMAGWEHDILAPAGGLVTYARNDVPDNPTAGVVEADLFRNLPDPVWANAGNCVVIDHKTGEYSVLCHMKHGSVLVTKGDGVEQGQVIGKLGNSGNSFGPHLHYHLQATPLIFGGDALPVQFENIDEQILSRGTYVTPLDQVPT
jgi:hypothetical protein